jgi:hypothetical protein
MSRHDGALAVLAALAGTVAILFTWQPGLASLYDDSVFYLMMAQAFSPFGRASAAVLAAAPFDTYPPFLPLLLALGGGAFDWRIAHAIVAACFGASVFLLGMHARGLTQSAAMGFAAALVYALMPGAWLNVKGILSEFPYMALSLGALVVHARAGGAAPAPRRAIALGVLLAALLLTRTVGIALMVAVAACEARHYWRDHDARRIARLGWMLGVPLACAALWIALRPSSSQDAYAEFGARMTEGAAREGAAWVLSIAGANARALLDAWLNALLIFWGEWWKPGFLLACLLGIAGIGATAWRALHFEPDGLYCVVFLAIVLAWPFPGQMYRLALPVIPLVMVNALWAWQRLLVRLRPESATRAPWAAALPLALCAPAVLFYIAERARAPEESGAPGRKADIAEFYRIPSGPAAAANANAQIEVFRDLERIGATTPQSARVLWYAPAYVALLGKRRGARLERPVDAADLASQARASHADFIYLADLHPRDSARRLGHPLDPAAYATSIARVVWSRRSPSGQLRSELLEFDHEKIRDNAKSP